MARCFAVSPPCKARPRGVQNRGMYTYDYHDGRHADWGSTGSTPPRWRSRTSTPPVCSGGNTLNMPPELVIDYHCWPEGAAEKARSLLKQNIVALTGVDCSGPAVLIAKEAENSKDSCGVRRRQRRKPEPPPNSLLLPQRDSSTKYEGYLLEVAKHYDIKEIAPVPHH